MPRRRISVFRRGLRKPGSSMIGEGGENRAARVHLVAERGDGPRVLGEVDVDARAEADETEPLSPRETVALADVAQDAPRNQAGDLHAGHICAAAGLQPQGVAL